MHHVLRVALALVFVSAGLLKLGDLRQFADRLGDFGLVPDALVFPTAWAVSALELLAGVALVVNLRGSLIAILLLLVTFLAVLAYGIQLGLDVECGCFGPGYHANMRTQFVIDLGLVLGCGLVYWTGRRCRVKTRRPADLMSRFFRRRRPPV